MRHRVDGVRAMASAVGRRGGFRGVRRLEREVGGDPVRLGPTSIEQKRARQRAVRPAVEPCRADEREAQIPRVFRSCF
jgi:hypothetical protein